jgi:hypothetical protein
VDETGLIRVQMILITPFTGYKGKRERRCISARTLILNKRRSSPPYNLVREARGRGKDIKFMFKGEGGRDKGEIFIALAWLLLKPHDQRTYCMVLQGLNLGSCENSCF